jgi:hypothetical protein
MAEAQETPDELGIKTPFGEISSKGKRTAEIITVFLLVGLGILAALFWTHHESTEKGTAALTNAVNNLTVAQREQTSAIRENTCVNSLPESQRKEAYASPYSLCKQMGR